MFHRLGYFADVFRRNDNLEREITYRVTANASVKFNGSDFAVGIFLRCHLETEILTLIQAGFLSLNACNKTQAQYN